MKKLMVALTAVALGACAWADEAALTGKVEFKDATEGQWTPDTNWAYTGDAEALNIVGDEGSRVLEIKTGSAALTREVWTDGLRGAIGDGIFIDTTIDFQSQALDDVPVVTNDEKLAIFVLDTTDIEGAPAGTNVFVMAGYGPLGKALYRLAGFDAEFAARGQHRVVVKSYANVIADGNRTGFLVYIQNGAEATITPCKVNLDGVYVLNEDGSVNWTTAGSASDYLGLTENFKTTAAVARWTNPATDSACLFFSMPTATDLVQGQLAAVDFIGNAQIASVEVTATDPGFPADLYTMALKTVGVTVEMVSEDFALVDGAVTATEEGGTVVVKVTPDQEEWMITAVGATQNAEGNWKFAFVNGGSVSFTGSAIAAYVGKTPYASITEAIAAFKDTAGATLKLAQNTVWPDTELAATDLTLDLNGQTLTLATDATLIYVNENAKLTIIDSAGYGKIVGAGQVYNNGILAIEKGVFDVEVVNDTEYAHSAKVTITGGYFSKDTNGAEAFTLAGSVAEGYEIGIYGNYWMVQEKQKAEVTLTIDPSSQGATISGVVDGGTYTEGEELEVTVTPQDGFKNVKVEITGAAWTYLSSENKYTLTVGTQNINIKATATAITYATLTITPVENCTITVKNGETAVESGTKFDVDDEVPLTVTRTPAEGYELVDCAAEETITMTTDQTVTATVKKSTPEVTPGAPVADVEAESAEEAAAKVELKAESPNEEIVSTADYTGYFTKQATATGEGKYTVSAVLKDEIVQASDVTAEVAADLGTVAAAAEDTTVTVTTAKAGLYYSVKYTDDVQNITSAAEGERVMAGSDGSVTIKLPKVSGSKAFYQVQVNVTAE
ncbi:MAG: hypothetical protein ACI4RD_09330 [Kiritimatiellia bacterium]